MMLASMSDRTRAGLGRTISAFGVAATVGGILGLILIGMGHILFRDWVVHNGAVAVAFGVLAFLTVKDQPRNGVIWVAVWAAFCGGVYCLIELGIYAYLEPRGLVDNFSELRPVDLPVVIALLAQIVSWIYIPGIFGPLTLGLLLFPDGLLPSPRWRWVGWATAIILLGNIIVLAYAFRPTSRLLYLYTAEIDVTAYEVELGRPLTIVFFALNYASVVALLACLAAVVVRFQRSVGLVRDQFKWVMWGASVAVMPLSVAVIVDTARGSSNLSRVYLLIAVAVLITSYGIAIRKYRLYAIDAVISRTVVFALLAGFITLVYAAIVVGLGRVLGSSQGGLLLPIGATAVVAIAFEPVRHRAQRWANRLVRGPRATPYEVLADLTVRLSHAEPGEGILDRMARRLVTGTGAERATIWIRRGDGTTAAASAPDGVEVPDAPDPAAAGLFDIRHERELVGSIEIVKPHGASLSTAERHLIEDLAGSAGAVLGYERLNESLADAVRQLEHSRARVVDAQDAERRRMERELREGTELQVASLKRRIENAIPAAEMEGLGDVGALLAGMSNDVQAALEEIRGLARGIYPPVLESDGVLAAISSLAAAAPVAVEIDGDSVGRYPGDIEAAVYFDISEAVTNAVKHAFPPIRVSIGEADGALWFSVMDQGPGFDKDGARRGSGLENLHDRMDAVGGSLDVNTAPGEPTTILGRVPLERVSPDRVSPV
jgi:signal transduction histidine kinase